MTSPQTPLVNYLDCLEVMQEAVAVFRAQQLHKYCPPPQKTKSTQS